MILAQSQMIYLLKFTKILNTTDLVSKLCVIMITKKIVLSNLFRIMNPRNISCNQQKALFKQMKLSII